MTSNSVPAAVAQELAAIQEAHAAYVLAKATALKNIAKITAGKAKTTADSLEACKKWLGFIVENDEWVAKRYNANDFSLKIDKAYLINAIETLENGDQAVTKIAHDAIYTDLRFYWSTAEGYYDEAAEEDETIREKYKSLPSIAPERMTDAQKEKTFAKLEKQRNGLKASS